MQLYFPVNFRSTFRTPESPFFFFFVSHFFSLFFSIGTRCTLHCRTKYQVCSYIRTVWCGRCCCSVSLLLLRSINNALLLLMQQHCCCFLLVLFVIVCRKAKFVAGSLNWFLSLQTRFIFSAPLAVRVLLSHLLPPSAYIGDHGHARSQRGRQLVAANPPLGKYLVPRIIYDTNPWYEYHI